MVNSKYFHDLAINATYTVQGKQRSYILGVLPQVIHNNSMSVLIIAADTANGF